MPDVLAAGWLVVLARGDFRTVECDQCLRDYLDGFLDRDVQTRGQRIQILDVLVGDDDNVSRVVRPLVGSDKGGDGIGPQDDGRFFVPTSGRSSPQTIAQNGHLYGSGG